MWGRQFWCGSESESRNGALDPDCSQRRSAAKKFCAFNWMRSDPPGQIAGIDRVDARRNVQFAIMRCPHRVSSRFPPPRTELSRSRGDASEVTFDTGVDFTTDEYGESGEIQPEDEYGDAREGTVGRAVRAKLRGIEGKP